MRDYRKHALKFIRGSAEVQEETAVHELVTAGVPVPIVQRKYLTKLLQCIGMLFWEV